MGAQAGPEVCAHRHAALSPQFLCMVEDNYPETLKRLFVIKGKQGPLHEEVGGRFGRVTPGSRSREAGGPGRVQAALRGPLGV